MKSEHLALKVTIQTFKNTVKFRSIKTLNVEILELRTIKICLFINWFGIYLHFLIINVPKYKNKT